MNINLITKDISINTYILVGEINNNELINNLRNNIINNIDPTFKNKTNVKGDFTGFSKLNNNEYFANFIQSIMPEIQIICKFNFIIHNSWGNICRKGDEVVEHNHGGTNGFCGILYLTENGPGTYFKDYDIKIDEKIGRFVLFHPLLFHSVEKINSDIERITIAFNMEKTKNWENYPDTIWK